MSSASASSTAPLPRPGEVLADLLPASRVREVALVATGVAVMALLAQVVVPVPGSPVPITGQTLGLVLVATTLGPARSVTVMGLYIAAALVGLPFYSGAGGGYEVVVGATGGYVLGFLPAAYLMGRAARLGADRHFLRALPLFVAGQLVVFAVGVPWLAMTTGMGAAAAVAAGFTPFLLGGAVKALVAAVVVPGVWRALGR